jgi:hypothetical protein
MGIQEQHDELTPDSTTPLPAGSGGRTSSSTSVQLPAGASWLHYSAKPFAALAALGLAWMQILPDLKSSIQLAYGTSSCGWGAWIGPAFYFLLAALCINRKTISDVGGVVGAAGNLVDKLKSLTGKK